jgi:hypothetical protein
LRLLNVSTPVSQPMQLIEALVALAPAASAGDAKAAPIAAITTITPNASGRRCARFAKSLIPSLLSFRPLTGGR